MARRLARLCWELMKISLLVVGGGYAIIVVADEVFSRLGWIEEGELVDRLPVFQSIPGLIATHTAVYVGDKVGGLPGAALGVAAVAVPSVVVFTAVSASYDSLPLAHPCVAGAFVGLRGAMTGIIAATLARSWRKSLPDAFAYSLLAACLAALTALEANVVAVLLAAMVAGVAAEFGGGKRPGTRRFPSCALLPLLMFFKYGALCFGGGFVLVPMYLADFVGPSAPWLRLGEAEFANLMALTQMTPGPIGVNGATYFGYRLFGFAGALLASAALLLPGSVLCLLAIRSLERFRSSRVVRALMRGVRPASVALMLVALGAFAKMSLPTSDGKGVSPSAAAIVLAAALLVGFRRLNVMAVIALAAVCGSVAAWFRV